MLQKFTFIAEEDGHPPSLMGMYSGTQFPVAYKVRAIKRKSTESVTRTDNGWRNYPLVELAFTKGVNV